MDQFEKDYKKETGERPDIETEGIYTEDFVKYLKNRLKDEIEKNRQLIEYSKLL